MSSGGAIARTPSDIELMEYIQITQTIKQLEIRREELKEICIARGSFCSRNFVCSIKDQSRTGLAGLKEVEKALGRSILEYHDLIRISHFKIVNISAVDKMFRLATTS